MSRSALALRPVDPARHRSPYPAARARAAAAGLTAVPRALGLTTPAFGFGLPRLTNIPTEVTFSGKNRQLQTVAYALAHGGILNPSHFGHGGLKGAIRAALTELITPYEARWSIYRHKLSMGFSADVKDSGHDYLDEDCYGRSMLPADAHPAGITFCCNDWTRDALIIGRKLHEFEENNPGRGKDLMFLIEAGLGQSVGAITPYTAWGIVQMHCWMGEGTPSEMLEEARLNWDGHANPTDAEVAEAFNLPLQCHIDTWFPDKWAYQFPKRKTLPKFDVLRGPNASRIVLAANQLSASLRLTNRKFGGTLNQHHKLHYASEFARPILLRWSDEDRIPALYDDVMQQDAQSGECMLDLCGAILFDQNDPADCRLAGARLRMFLEVTSQVDELLSLFVSDMTLAQIFGRGTHLNQQGTGQFDFAEPVHIGATPV